MIQSILLSENSDGGGGDVYQLVFRESIKGEGISINHD